MSGGSKTQNVSQTTEPPDYIRPYLHGAASESQRLYDQGPQQYYPGQTVVPFANETNDAIVGITRRANAGSPVNQNASSFAANTLGKTPTSQFGGGQNPFANADNPYGAAQNPYANASNPFGTGNNPHLDAQFNRAADQVQNRVQSGFAGSGRNVEAGRAVAAQEMNDLATNMYGGAYEGERNRQLQYQSQLTGIGAQGFENAQSRDLQYRGQLTGIGSQGYELERDRMAGDIQQQRQQQLGVLGMAPQIANQDYYDMDRLRGVGAEYEDRMGREMEDQAARWDYAQQAPGLSLDQYITRLQGQPGSSVTTSTPIYRNQVAGGLGGAMAGSEIGGQFGYGGWGALLGGLAGAFGS
jgi:hypothetical protein